MSVVVVDAKGSNRPITGGSSSNAVGGGSSNVFTATRTLFPSITFLNGLPKF
jgi:hypothetical protein